MSRIRKLVLASLPAIALATAVANAAHDGDFQSTATSGTVRDHDGNVYRWVRIGEQVWMAENLATTRYPNGDTIPDGAGVDPAAIGPSSKYRFAYDNEPKNAATYGLLYTWAAALNGQDYDPSGAKLIQGACPDGWHIPHDSEWHELERLLGVSEAELRDLGSRGTNAGGKLKATDPPLWQSPNLGATDEFGFTAVPAGYYLDGKFARLGEGTYFWGPEYSENEFAINHNLRYNEAQIGRGQGYKRTAFSVRCVRN